MAAAIEEGAAAKAVLAALGGDKQALIEAAGRAVAAGSPAPLTEMGIALVAIDGATLVGTLYAMPPGNYIGQLVARGIEPARATVIALAVVNIKALAVDPAYRGCGVASSLLAECVRLYSQLGYRLLHGSFDSDSGLEAFYAARGFEIVPLGSSIQMDILVGQPARLGAEPGERIFMRWQ